MNSHTIKFCSALLLSAVLSACGGGSGGGSAISGSAGIDFQGNISPAAIDDSNAESIGKAAGESVLQASSSSALPAALEISEDVDLSSVHSSIIETSKLLATLPSGIDLSEICTGGGSASSNTPSGSGRVVQRVTYNNCTISGSYTIDGVVVITYENISDMNAGISISYQNVTVSGVGITNITINYTWTCTNLSDSTTCTTSSIFEGSDGQTHQVSDFEITGSSETGYNGTATFSHYTYGTVSIVVSGITYGNCGTLPDGGSISFSSTNGSSANITFNYNVDDGCSVTGSWENSISASSF